MALVRSECRDLWLRAGLDDPEAAAGGPSAEARLSGGRVPHTLLRVEGERWVLKEYRRGGLLGAISPTRYWSYQRFLHELEVSSTATRAGVPTTDAVGLLLAPQRFGGVRAWLVTRFLADARPVSAFLGSPEESPIFEAAGRAVASMHYAGIDHPDLHLGNLLGVGAPDAARVYIVDWDKATHRVPGSWNPHSNLLRLWRSVKKGQQTGKLSQPSAQRSEPAQVRIGPILAFSRGYFQDGTDARRRARVYFRWRQWTLRVRSLFWRSAER